MNAIRLLMLLVILSLVTVIQCGLYGFNTDHVRRVKELSEKIWIHGADNVPDAERDISGFDLSDTVLEGLNLSYVRAHGVDFRGTTLKNVFMVGADLYEANFSNNHESRTILTQCIIGAVNLKESLWEKAKVQHCVIWDCAFDDAKHAGGLKREENKIVLKLGVTHLGPFVLVGIDPVEIIIVRILEQYVRYAESGVYHNKAINAVEDFLSEQGISVRAFDWCRSDNPIPCVKQRSDCSICKNNFSPDDLIGILPCGHIFCCECITPWLNSKIVPTCPDCRRIISLKVGVAIAPAYTVVSELDTARAASEEEGVSGK